MGAKDFILSGFANRDTLMDANLTPQEMNKRAKNFVLTQLKLENEKSFELGD